MKVSLRFSGNGVKLNQLRDLRTDAQRALKAAKRSGDPERIERAQRLADALSDLIMDRMWGNYDDIPGRR